MTDKHARKKYFVSEIFNRGNYSGVAVHPCHFYFEGSKQNLKHAISDADFIVKACNNHDKLVEALTEIEAISDDEEHNVFEKEELVILTARKALRNIEAV